MDGQDRIEISVVIPTYNRKKTLLECLRCFEAQTLRQEHFEVIVVDDGSDDGTDRALAEAGDSLNLKLSSYRQENAGPARARNAGIRSASGSLCLFTGDDIMVSPGFLMQHLETHKRYPESHIAVLGSTTWSEDIQVTPFMQWLEKGGFQFDFQGITDSENVSCSRFYTSNISLKKEYLLANGLFDEDFPFAAYEDYELGYRLQKDAGLRIVYNPEAGACHKHPVTIDSSLQRAEVMGRALALLHGKHPELRKARYRQMLKLQEYLAAAAGAGMSRVSFSDAVQVAAYKLMLYSRKIKGYREHIG